MGFECAYCPLGCIPSVQVRRHKLVSDPPLFFHGCLVLLAAFIVEDLEVNKQVPVFEPLHNGIIRSDTVFVFTRGKRFNQDNI